MKLLLIIAFLLNGCSIGDFNKTPQSNNKLKLANEIRTNVAKKLKQKYGLKPCGSGGQMMYDIKMLALSFDYYKPIDIKAGRQLLVAAVDEFKNAINSDERIRPYLSNYPFEAKNIEIRIFFYKLDGSKRNMGDLSVISAIDGILKYSIDNLDNTGFEIVQKETYQEAIKKIKQDKIISHSRKMGCINETILSLDEQLANKITEKVAKKLKQKYGLQPCGSGGQMMYDIKMLALSFDYYKPIDIKTGRQLLIAAVDEFKNAINNDERIRPYLSNYPFEAKNIQIRIFLNSDSSSSKSEKLIVIKTIDGNLIYNIRDLDSKLPKTIHKETYQEAIKKIKEDKIISHSRKMGCINETILSLDEQLANEITEKVAKKLKQKYDLHPCGSGGQMMYDVKMLALSFDYYKPIDIKTGRQLLIAAVDEFKNAINNDERIRPYLSNYPFEAKNIEIRIFFYKLDGSKRNMGDLSVISAIDGILKYSIDNLDNTGFEIVQKETYQDAVKKINPQLL